MADASEFLPSGFTPAEEQMFEKAECKVCGLKRYDDVRAWAHHHVRDTGHNIELHFGYDVRDKEWFDRLSYERQAEIEKIRGKGR